MWNKVLGVDLSPLELSLEKSSSSMIALETEPVELAQKLAQDGKIRLIRHEKNQGKGAALQTGFQTARGEVILIQDADLEYNPEEYPKLLKPIIEGKADVVFGSRFMGGEPHRVLYFWHYLGNRFLTLLSNMTTNLNLTDMETCYKVFRAEILRSIPLKEKRFGFEPEVTAKVARRGCRIYEVGISYTGGPMPKVKKSTGKTACGPCIASLNTAGAKPRGEIRVGSILVTGGAGYIGSVVGQTLLERGHSIIVLDSLEEGHREAVSEKAVFFQGNIGDEALLKRIFDSYPVSAVIHLAAFCLVGESVQDPEKYYLNNVVNGLTLLKVMRSFGVRKMVFSSTAAVYGEPQALPITEDPPDTTHQSLWPVQADL